MKIDATRTLPAKSSFKAPSAAGASAAGGGGVVGVQWTQWTRRRWHRR